MREFNSYLYDYHSIIKLKNLRVAFDAIWDNDNMNKLKILVSSYIVNNYPSLYKEGTNLMFVESDTGDDFRFSLITKFDNSEDKTLYPVVDIVEDDFFQGFMEVFEQQIKCNTK